MLDSLVDFLPIITGVVGIAAGAIGGKKIGSSSFIGIIKTIVTLTKKNKGRKAVEAFGVVHGEKASRFMSKAVGKATWEASEDELIICVGHYVRGLKKGMNLDD